MHAPLTGHRGCCGKCRCSSHRRRGDISVLRLSFFLYHVTYHIMVKIFLFVNQQNWGYSVPATIVSYAGHFSLKLLDGLTRHHRKSERLFKVIFPRILPTIVLNSGINVHGVRVSQVWIFSYWKARGISEHPDLKHDVIAELCQDRKHLVEVWGPNQPRDQSW